MDLMATLKVVVVVFYAVLARPVSVLSSTL